MRPLALAAAAGLAAAVLACGGEDSAPAPDAGAVTGPTVFFVQIET